MIKKRVAGISLLITACLCGCSEDEISDEITKSAEILTEAIKEPKIATGGYISAEDKVTEVVSIKVVEEPEEVRNARTKQKIAKEKEKEEETTGDIDINGYGWVQLQYSAPYHVSEKHLTRSGGVFYYNDHKETWYSTKEKAGQSTAVRIPDKHVADDGTIRDKDGYICVASSDLDFYSIIMTSLGPAKVYDCGCSSGTIDIYTNW